jgi:peptidoglycan/xylan/chitin deacetylase (PgdA/CDA1 family)
LGASHLRLLLKRSCLGILEPLVATTHTAANCIPVLCYHRVLPELIEEEPFSVWSILPEQFESQMAFLTGNGFNTLSLSEYARMARGLEPVKERSVLITFDDGFGDNYAIAWMIAQKYNIKINLFICPSYISQMHPIVMQQDGYEAANSIIFARRDESVRAHIGKYPQLWRPLNWQELKRMQGSGVDIGLHSHRHRNLTLLTTKDQVIDTATGIAVMSRELGQRPKFYALPYGWFDHYTPEIISMLQSFSLELIFAAHLGRAKLPSNQQIFPRILITQQDNLATFRQKIEGVHDWWGNILRITHALTPKHRK